MAPSDVICWSALSDVAWYFILKQLPWRDIGRCRATCRCWRRDVDRCLQRLHLRDPTPDCLARLGNTFTHLATVKVTAVNQQEDVRLDELSELPGALGRAGTLRLRSKRPGGCVLAVGQLHMLKTAGSLLTVLSLRSCEVTSWAGLEACQHLTHLQLIHCRFSEAACMGLMRTLGGLPRLTSLELRCATARSPRSTTTTRVDGAVLHHHQYHHHQQHRHHHQQQQNQQNQQLYHYHNHHPHSHHQYPHHHHHHQQQHHAYQNNEHRYHSIEYDQQHHPRHHQHQHQHHHHMPQLSGLGSCAPHLAVLKVSAALPEVALQGLLRLELPSIRNLLDLDLELHPVASTRRVSLEHAQPGPDGSLNATVSYRELSALIPTICMVAPHLTSLHIKGHSRLQDRDLQLLQPLRHLRHLSLDLLNSGTATLRHPPQPQPPHQPHQPVIAHPEGPSEVPLPMPLSGGGVASLLRGAPGLQSLSLAHSAWCPMGLRTLSDAASLTQLRLAGAELPKGFTLCNFLYSFRGLQNLEELDLGGCAGLTDWGLALLGRCAVRLRRLNVGGCGELASDVGIAALAPLMSRLQRLDLSFMDRLTDRGLAGLLRNGACALQLLSLNYCSHVQDTGVLAVVASCPSLQHLGLDYCIRVSATGAKALRNLRELRRLSAEGCAPSVQAALAGLPAARPKHSHAAARWWLATTGGVA